MFSKKKKSRKSYGILGLGRFGYALGMELAEAGADLLIVDSDEEKARDFRELTENVYVVKGYDKKDLMSTGIQYCDVAVVCIGEQVEKSLLMTLSLISMCVPKVIAKATSDEHGEILERLGAEVVYPERDMAVRLARRLESDKMLDYIQLSSKVNISKTIVPDHLLGRTVQAANLRKRFSLNIVTIEHADGTVLDPVRPDDVFQPGDILYLAGSKEGINRLIEWIEDE